MCSVSSVPLALSPLSLSVSFRFYLSTGRQIHAIAFLRERSKRRRGDICPAASQRNDLFSESAVSVLFSLVAVEEQRKSRNREGCRRSARSLTGLRKPALFAALCLNRDRSGYTCVTTRRRKAIRNLVVVCRIHRAHLGHGRSRCRSRRAVPICRAPARCSSAAGIASAAAGIARRTVVTVCNVKIQMCADLTDALRNREVQDIRGTARHFGNAIVAERL